MRRSNRSPTIALLTGLAVTLSAVAVYSGYTIFQLRGLRQLQTQTIDRDRTDSLLLLRIQNDLNSMALTIRDMLDANEPYPLAAWQGQCRPRWLEGKLPLPLSSTWVGPRVFAHWKRSAARAGLSPFAPRH